MIDDEEADKPRRPNANYKLSNVDKGDSVNGEVNLNFHYNRERRLEKAPQSVRDLYTQQPARGYRFSLLRPLIADKPRAFVFFTIIALCVMIFLLSILGLFGDSYTLDDNKIEVTAAKLEGTTLVSVKKTAKGKTPAYTGAVDVAFSPVISSPDEEMSIFQHRIFFSMEQVEEYRFAVPFDSPELLMVLQSEKSAIKINLKLK